MLHPFLAKIDYVTLPKTTTLEVGEKKRGGVVNLLAYVAHRFTRVSSKTWWLIAFGLISKLLPAPS